MGGGHGKPRKEAVRKLWPTTEGGMADVNEHCCLKRFIAKKHSLFCQKKSLPPPRPNENDDDEGFFFKTL